MKRLPDTSGVACILLDIKILGLSGPELQNRLNALGSRLPIIFVSGFADIPTTVHVMKSGAEDVLTKPVSKQALVQAIERAHARSRTLREKHEQLDLLSTLLRRLSPRERQVFERVVRGKMNEEIARELGSTERTIKGASAARYGKVRVASLAELAMIAERLGIFASEDDPIDASLQAG